MSEQVTEGGIHQRPRQPAPGLLWLVHVARGVQRVQAPVTLLLQIFLGGGKYFCSLFSHLSGRVPGVVELGAVVGGGLLDDEHVARHAVQRQPQQQPRAGVLAQ